jgi:hypothetical protein
LLEEISAAIAVRSAHFYSPLNLRPASGISSRKKQLGQLRAIQAFACDKWAVTGYIASVYAYSQPKEASNQTWDIPQ